MEDLDQEIPVKIIKGEDTYDLHVMWSIHNKCNYSCSYCPSEVHGGNFNWLKLDILKGFIDKIEKHYVQGLGYKKILFSFTGGEPTLWPDFIECITYINKKGFRVGITTNAHVSVNYWKNVSTFFDYICLSFHPESADIDNFIAVFEQLHNDKRTVIPSVRVMMHPEQKFWDKSVYLISKLKKFPNWTYECVHILEDYGLKNIKTDYGSKDKEQFIQENSFQSQFKNDEVVYEPIVGFNYNVEYKNKKIEKLDENKLINEGKASFKGWNCFIGLEQLFIHYTGMVKRAGCNVSPDLGTIMEYEKIEFPSNPVKCNRANCFCPTDIRITKSAPEIPASIKYETPAIEPKMITGPTSFYKYRMVVEEAFDINTEKRLDKIEQFMLSTIKLKNILPSTYLSFHEIESYSGESLDLIKAYFKRNPSVVRSVVLKDYKANLKSIKKVLDLIKDCDYIDLQFKGELQSKLILMLILHAQNFVDTRIVFTIDYNDVVEDLEGLKALIQKGLSFKQELKVVNISASEEKKLGKILKHYQYNAKSEVLAFHSINYLKGDMQKLRLLQQVDDEIVLNSDDQPFRHSTNEKTFLKNFNGWKCFKGISNVFIHRNGEVLSSQCELAVRLGNLDDVNSIETNISSTTCSLKECNNKMDCTIKKELV